MVSGKSERVIVPINESANDKANLAPAFYCVHSLSGASGSDFLDLARHLDGAIRFFGIQAPPKRTGNPEFGNSIPLLAEYYANAVVEAQPSGPIILGGWSAGATIALAVAKNLRGRGRKIDLIVAIDGAPENTHAALSPLDPRYLVEAAEILPSWLLSTVVQRNELPPLIAKHTSRAIGKVRELVRPRQDSHAVADEEPQELFLGFNRYPLKQRIFMKRLYDAIFDYMPEAYDGDVVVYESKICSPFNLPQFGRIWRSIAPSSDTVRVDGTHLSILKDPIVRTIARDIIYRISMINDRRVYDDRDGGDGNPVASAQHIDAAPPPPAS